MKSFFNYLFENDLSPKKLETTVSHWSLTKFADFLINSHDHINFASTENNPTLFDFASSSNLSGESIECANFECRLKKAKHLANFATLYANRVIIVNPLPSFPPLNYSQIFIEDFINTIKILYFFRPLLEEGIISLTPREITLCHECSSDLKNLDRKLHIQAKELLRPHLKDIDVNFEKVGKYTFIEFKGPEKIFGHTSYGKIVNYNFDKLKRKRKITHVVEHLEPVIEDLIFQNISAKRNFTNFLTDNDFYVEMVESLNKSEINSFNNSLMNNFSHNLPIVTDSNIKNLLKLRKNEGESFVVYRDAVVKALNEGLSSKADNIENIFNDIVLPEINKIELTFKNSRKILSNSLKKDIVVSSGFIGIGLFSGILTPHLNEMLVALGGYNFVTCTANKIYKIFNEPEEIRNSNYYFLWKALKLKK